MSKKNALVTGAAGFIGGHLCGYLKQRGYFVYATDYVKPRYGDVPCNMANWSLDLREYEDIKGSLMQGVVWDEIYALAADMGGMGYIGNILNQVNIMRNNALINANLAKLVRDDHEQYLDPDGLHYRTLRTLFTSSACVYPEHLQVPTTVEALGTVYDAPIKLKETQAWFGRPDTAYGVEKLFSEHVWMWAADPPRIAGTIARFHNIYGPNGSWNDGREKAPAAMCRKIAKAKLTGNPEVEIWSDGEQRRSFCYIDDCLEMLYRLMQSRHHEPLNIGTDRSVTINELADIIADIAGIKIEKKHIPGPRGVRFRNADLAKMREVLDYEPQVSLEDGLKLTYEWIVDRVGESLDGA